MSVDRAVLCVDFGDVLQGRILTTSEMLGISKSELVRAAVTHFLDGEYYDKGIVSKEEKNQVKTSKKEEVYLLVQVYNDTFYSNTTPPKQYYPALYKCFNAARKAGISTSELKELINVSPSEPFVQKMVREKKKPSLPYLLSQGMIPRLMVTLQDQQAEKAIVSEADLVEYKFDIIDKYANKVPFEQRDTFIGQIESAGTVTDIDRIVDNAVS